jgi:hypothetical protein
MVDYVTLLSLGPISGPTASEPSNAQGCIAILNTEMSPQRYLADSNWDLIRSEG